MPQAAAESTREAEEVPAAVSFSVPNGLETHVPDAELRVAPNGCEASFRLAVPGEAFASGPSLDLPPGENVTELRHTIGVLPGPVQWEMPLDPVDPYQDVQDPWAQNGGMP